MMEEMKKFQGTWKQIAYEKDGLKEPLDEHGWEPRVTLAGDTFIVTLSDGSTPIKGTFKLDPTREPKAMDPDRHLRRGRGENLSGDLLPGWEPNDLLCRRRWTRAANGIQNQARASPPRPPA